MPDRSTSPPEPLWGPASTHQTTGRRPAGPSASATAPAAGADTPVVPPASANASSGTPSSDNLPWGARPATTAKPRRRRRFPRGRVAVLVLLILVALIAYPFLLVNRAMGAVHRLDALPADTLPDTPGTNYLVVGSDSRTGTQFADSKTLDSARSDTIILLHVPNSGPASLVSIPRDSYVPIPGHDRNKINAAFSIGGPKLLVQTVESATGVKIDRYVATNLIGLKNVVDAVGGITVCPTRAYNDADSGLVIGKGCQNVNGATALAYARMRHSDPEGDLGRVKRQREVISAIVKKAASPSSLLNPFNAFSLAGAGGNALSVDQGAGAMDLMGFFLGMRSVTNDGYSLTVPISNPALSTNHGVAVQWDREKALELFTAIKKDDSNAIKAIAGT